MIQLVPVLSGDPWATIGYAISQASDGDTINVAAGTYTEQLTITNKGVTITGESETGVIVQAAATQTGTANVFTIDADGYDITIQYMTIRYGDYGIRSGAGNVNVLHTTLYNNGWDGTGLPDPDTDPQGDFVTFYSTSATTSGGAIRIENSTSSEIAYNTVYDNDRGIRLQDGSNGDIHDNVSHGNIQSGIYLATSASPYSGTAGCTDTLVYDNNVYGNMNNGILIIGGHTNTIRDNNVHDNWTSGIAADYPSEITIQGNTINNNNIYGFTGQGTQGENHGGVFLSGGTNVTSRSFTAKILSNTISNNNSGKGANAEGIRITSSVFSDGISILNNTFINHDLDIYVLSQAATTAVNYNSFDGTGIGIQNNDTSATLDAEYNWWGDCSGPGGVGPGSGDAVSAYVLFDPWWCSLVEIDIKPGNGTNSINPKSKGVIPVAILGSDTFDVTDVDVTTLEFGPSPAGPAHDLTDPVVYADHLQDVNGDGFTDLVSHYRTRDTGIDTGGTEATLTGATNMGLPIVGTDTIRTVGKP